jgi:hypothetical protein
MIALSRFLVAILPTVTVGGLLLSSAAGHAQGGNGDAFGYWPAGADTTARGAQIAQADPPPRRPAMPPVPPVPPMPAMPPSPPAPPSSHRHGHRRGMSVSIHDGKIEIDGVADMVQEQLDRVNAMLDSQPDLPPDVRARVKVRIKNVRERLGVRLNRLKSLDLDKIGPEMERMGDEIEREMDGLDKDLEKLGDKFGKDLGKDFAKIGKDFGKDLGKDIARSFSAPPAPPSTPPPAARDNDSDNDNDGDSDDDDDDDKSAVAAVDHDSEAADAARVQEATTVFQKLRLDLDQEQKAQLAKLRADSDQRIKSAKQELEALSNQLQHSLGDDTVSEAEIAQQVDRISKTEATIRKARLLAWVRARSLLNKDQRRRVEAAMKKDQ